MSNTFVSAIARMHRVTRREDTLSPNTIEIRIYLKSQNLQVPHVFESVLLLAQASTDGLRCVKIRPLGSVNGLTLTTVADSVTYKLEFQVDGEVDGRSLQSDELPL